MSCIAFHSILLRQIEPPEAPDGGGAHPAVTIVVEGPGGRLAIQEITPPPESPLEPPQNIGGSLGVPGVVVVYLNGHLRPQSIWISYRASRRTREHSGASPIRTRPIRYSGATKSLIKRTLAMLGLAAR